MEPLLTQITHYLFRQSWHIALLIAAVAAVSFLARNRSAHVRYLLWLIVLAKCLVPPLYTVPLAVLPQRPAPEPAVATPPEAPPLSLELIEAARPQPYVSPPLPSVPVPAQELVTPSRATIAQHLSKVSLRQWLGLGWIGGALFVLAALIKAWRTNRWLRRDRRHLPENLQAKVDKFFCDLGIKTRPKVWLITGVGQPFVWGMLRGSIYLPGKFEQVNGPVGWRGILGHELSHVMRFDAAVNLLQVIAQSVYWFHPLVCWANRRVREEREKCCDEMAIVRLNTQPKDYSTAIVNTLIAEHKAKQPVPSLAIAGPVKNIEDRIKTIMKSGKKFYRRPTFVTIVTVLLLAAVAVPTTLALTSREKETAREKTATEAETNWGEAVEGVALRLRPGEQIISNKKKDELRLDLRNDRSEMFPASAFYHSVWLEVDGRWYRPRESSDTVPALEIKPGGTAEPFRKFVLQAGVNKFWNGGFSGVTPPPKMTFYEKLVQMGLPLVLVCGSHTVRTAIAMSEGHYGYVYAISNPVEIKIAKTAGSIKPEVVKALIEKLGDKDTSVQVSAIKALGDIGPEVQSATPILINKLSQEKGSLTWSIATALGRIGPAEIVIPALLNHKYKHETVDDLDLFSMAQGMCHFGADAEPYLIAAMKDDDSSARYNAMFILVEFSPMFNGTIPELIGMLKNEKTEVRSSVAYALGRMTPPAKEAIPSIVLMLEDENPKLRRAAAHTLMWFGGAAKEAVPALAQALRDEDGGVRGAAAFTLGEFSKLGLDSVMHDALIKVVPALIQALDDEHTSMVMGATITLGRIGDKRAAKRIAQLLEREFKPHERYSSNPNFINVPTAAHHALMSIMVEDFNAEKIIAVDSQEKLEEVREFWQKKLQVEGQEQNLKRLFSRPKLEQKINDIVQSAAISPEEKSGLRITGEGTWGEVVDGLQFGLECTSGKRGFRVGESVSFVFKLRNVGSEKIELEYVKPHLKDWAPNVRGISGSVCAALPPVQVLSSMSGAYGMGGGEVQRRTLKPGEEWTLDEAAFTIRPVGWEGKVEQTTVFAAAGKYKVNHTLVFPPSYGGRGEELWHGQLASNETELEILPAGATTAARSDASEEDIETVLRLLGDYVSQRLHAASGGSVDGDAWQRNRSAWEARCAALSAGQIEYLGHLANGHPEAGYRAAACEALGETKNAQAAEFLVGPLGDKAPYVRHRAARALGSLRSQKHIAELLRVLKSDTDSGVRAGAAFTLGNIGSKRATKGLVEALEFDKEGQVPEAVLFALMHITDASALPALRAELEQETNSERRRVLENVIRRIEESAWGEAPATEDIDAMVRDVLYETYDIGTAAWSPMTGTLYVERFLELMQKQPPGQKLFAIAANGTDAQKRTLLQSVKRMCNIYLNELPEFQLDPNVPWQATVVHSPGVMVYPALLLQLEDDPAQTLDIVTRMYLRRQDAYANYFRAKGKRERIDWGTSDTGTIMAHVCHSCMSRLGSDDKFKQRATAEQLRALREYEGHRTKTPKLGPADDEISVMKFAARVRNKQAHPDGKWAEQVERVQLRLQTKKVWKSTDVPQFRVQVPNLETQILHSAMQVKNWEIEVDGIWCELWDDFSGGAQLVLQLAFKPDQQDQLWLYPAYLQAKYGRKKGGTTPQLTPGTHTIRFAFTAAEEDERPNVRAVSNPVEIEILAAEAGGDFDLVGAVKEGTARLRAATGIKRSKGKTSEQAKKIEFLGLDLTRAPRTTDWAQLPDLFEERPPGSKSYEIRTDVKVVFSWLVSTVYYVPARNIFYVQHDDIGSSVFHYYGPFEGDPYEVLDLEIFYKDLLGYSDVLKSRPTMAPVAAFTRLFYQVDANALSAEDKKGLLDKTVNALKNRLASAGKPDEVWIDVKDEKLELWIPSSDECLERLGVSAEWKERSESGERLDRLGRMLQAYAKDNQSRYPDTLEQLQEKGYIGQKELQWALEHVAYPAKGRTTAEPPDMVLAYDRLFLAAHGETYVIFNDGRLESAKADRLNGLGISSDVKPQLPAEPVPWGRPNNGLAIRLIVPRQEGETLPRLTFERFEAVLEVKNVSDRVIKLAEQNNTSGDETVLDDWVTGLVIDAHSLSHDAGRFFRADDHDGYWSRIGSMPSSRQIKPGEVARFRIRLRRLVNYDGQNLLSLRGRYRLRPVLQVRDDKFGLWRGETVGEYVRVMIGTEEVRSPESDERIADLMGSARTFQKQGRYKEALAQLEMVLALDPTHKQAWELTKTLWVETGLLIPEETMARVKSGRTQQVRQQLQRVVDLSQWSPEMAFADALEQLKRSAEPPLNIVVLWRDLEENAAIDRTTPINMEGVSGIYLGTALRLLLRSVSASGAEIDFVIKDGIIVIATKEALPSTLETRVYDIYGFAAQPVGVDAG